MNAPNFISLTRLVMVPVVVWLLLKGHYPAAFWVFIAAGISDAVDGFLAKRMGMRTVIGSFLDPLADKTLLVSVYVTLGYQDYIATWLVILVVFRDLIIIGGALLFETVTHSLTMQPLMISKINTLSQIVLVGVVLGGLGLSVDTTPWWPLLTWVTAATTVLSGAVYMVKWTRKVSAVEHTE